MLSLTFACAQKEPQEKAASAGPAAENYPSLMVEAKEINDAFARKDFARFMDLTYPKVVDMLGGRERMLSELSKQLQEMEAEGVVVLSSTPGTPTQYIHEAGSIYALLPTTLKVKARDGIFQSEGSTIAISSDGGAHWTFLDAGGKDQKQLGSLLPAVVVAKLNLLPEKPPARISDGN